ncbi:MAG: hypothetical protein ACRC92_26965 [Peptostreptococcaceae bacterium]
MTKQTKKKNERLIFNNFKEFYNLMDVYCNLICVKTRSRKERLSLLNDTLVEMKKPKLDNITKFTSKFRPILKHLKLKAYTEHSIDISRETAVFTISYKDMVELLDIDTNRRFEPYKLINRIKQSNDALKYGGLRVLSNIKDLSYLIRNARIAKEFIKMVLENTKKGDYKNSIPNFIKLCATKYGIPCIFRLESEFYTYETNIKLMAILSKIKSTLKHNTYNNKYALYSAKNDSAVTVLTRNTKYIFQIENDKTTVIKSNKKKTKVSDREVTNAVTTMIEVTKDNLNLKTFNINELEEMIKRYKEMI